MKSWFATWVWFRYTLYANKTTCFLRRGHCCSSALKQKEEAGFQREWWTQPSPRGRRSLCPPKRNRRISCFEKMRRRPCLCQWSWSQEEALWCSSLCVKWAPSSLLRCSSAVTSRLVRPRVIICHFKTAVLERLTCQPCCGRNPSCIVENIDQMLHLIQ